MELYSGTERCNRILENMMAIAHVHCAAKKKLFGTRAVRSSKSGRAPMCVFLCRGAEGYIYIYCMGSHMEVCMCK